MKIKVNDIELFYQQSGSGSPLILLHGNGEDHHIFDPLVQKLQKHFSVYALDSRNHGKSDSTGVYDYEVMAEDVDRFIQTMGLEQPAILGFSDGAIISLMLAVKQPERVGKMLLLGVNLSPADFTDECYQFTKETYEQTGDPLFKLMLEQPDIAAADLSQVKTPVYVIGGEDDIFKTETFTRVAQVLPNARLKIMTGHDHSSYIAGTDLLYSKIAGFLL